MSTGDLNQRDVSPCISVQRSPLTVTPFRTWEKCHCNQIVTVTRGSLVMNQSFGTCQKCHRKRVVTVNSVTVSGKICVYQMWTGGGGPKIGKFCGRHMWMFHQGRHRCVRGQHVHPPFKDLLRLHLHPHGAVGTPARLFVGFEHSHPPANWCLTALTAHPLKKSTVLYIPVKYRVTGCSLGSVDKKT